MKQIYKIGNTRIFPDTFMLLTAKLQNQRHKVCPDESGAHPLLTEGRGEIKSEIKFTFYINHVIVFVLSENTVIVTYENVST